MKQLNQTLPRTSVLSGQVKLDLKRDSQKGLGNSQDLVSQGDVERGQ